jgi:hypothetical protein
MRFRTERERRLVVIGLIAVAIYVAVSIYRPYRAALVDAREQLATQRDLLGRELALLDEVNDYPTAYRAADSALRRIAPRLFDEDDDVLAGARLTSYVAGHALASRVLLQEAESQTAQRSRDGVRKLQVEIRAESDTEGILRFLDALERGPKLVVVERIALTRGERSLQRGKPPTSVVELTATISGFALADSGTMRDPRITALAGGSEP